MVIPKKKKYNPYGVLNNHWLCKIDTLFKTKAVLSQWIRPISDLVCPS